LIIVTFKITILIKKLLFIFILSLSTSTLSALSFSNLVFENTIAPTALTLDITFDYTGVSANDTFEWQLFLAQPNGSPDWSLEKNIAYEGGITPNAVGSGTQTVTIYVFNNPVDREVFTWAGKITIGADGSDTGFNNTGNLVTVFAPASTEEFANRVISLYPNPVEKELNILNNNLSIE
jgi:hypothetical protein